MSQSAVQHRTQNCKFGRLRSTPANNRANAALIWWDATSGGDASAWSGIGTDPSGGISFHSWGNKYLIFDANGYMGVNTLRSSGALTRWRSGGHERFH